MQYALQYSTQYRIIQDSTVHNTIHNIQHNAQFTITEKTNVGTKKNSAGAFGQVENMAFASTTGVGYAASIPRAISTNGDATRRTILHYVASNENPMLGPRIRTFNDLIFNFKNTRPYVSRKHVFMENKKMTPGLWPNIGYP